MKQPVGVAVADQCIIVVCDDGTVWSGTLTRDQEHRVGKGIIQKVRWQQATPVPGTSTDSA